jgi:hypothetical protein
LKIKEKHTKRTRKEQEKRKSKIANKVGGAVRLCAVGGEN